MTPADKAKLDVMRKTLVRFRKKIAPLLGFNSFIQKGYESDDIIAMFTRHFENTRFIIVANDGDLFQLLRPGVSMFHSQMSTLIDRKEFLAHHHYAPEKVVAAKSVGGCTSDNVKGVPGIGEKKTLQFVQGTLPGNVFAKIRQNWEKVIFNKRLVCLPYTGTKMPRLKPFRLDMAGFETVCSQLGVTKLLARKEEIDARFNHR